LRHTWLILLREVDQYLVNDGRLTNGPTCTHMDVGNVIEESLRVLLELKAFEELT
jgi:hypothetical protein